MLSKSELEKIKKALPRNGVKAIAQQTGYSPDCVRKVLRGVFENKTVLEACILLASENKQAEKKLSKAIKAL